MSSMDLATIRLTETVTKGGCAAKLPAGELRKLLHRLKIPKPPELAVGTETMDDACLWDLGNGQFLIQTLDFFTPIVDDPYDFGAIAAANAMSDVFAMGGSPKIALTIMGFPASKLPMGLIEPLMAGAMDKITEAGACLAGGHSIDDDMLKLGFSVTGFVEKEKAWTNSGARNGDVLILTKGLGTGTIASALKSGKAEPGWIQNAVASMKQLNQIQDLIEDALIHAATDVTGFGFAGHALQMARASDKVFSINANALPVIEGAMQSIANKVLNRAHHSNAAYVKEDIDYGHISETLRWLSVDPQTSGGLLLSVAAQNADSFMKRLSSRFPLTRKIGTVKDYHETMRHRVVFAG